MRIALVLLVTAVGIGGGIFLLLQPSPTPIVDVSVVGKDRFFVSGGYCGAEMELIEQSLDGTELTVELIEPRGSSDNDCLSGVELDLDGRGVTVFVDATNGQRFDLAEIAATDR